jgi:DNA-binding Xre family transcriptional regulator
MKLYHDTKSNSIYSNKKSSVCKEKRLNWMCSHDILIHGLLLPCFGEVNKMAISYKKLWKLLIDKDMKKKDLQRVAGISSATVTKLGKNENVNTEILQKICTALNCDSSDIMEIIPDNPKKANT